MAKRIAAAILMCAVMVLVAAVPLALAGTHTIEKFEKGPNASAVSWSFMAPDYGMWTGKIANNGLRWINVDVVDDMGAGVLHQRIRFAAVNAFPTGEVTSNGAIMKKDGIYTITITPNGPKGTNCTVEDMFEPQMPPVAVISTPVVTALTVSVNGSLSYDQNPSGYVATYDWNFGDNAVATGPIATHTYAAPGTYTITLTVTDNDGLTGSTTTTVSPTLGYPVASFKVTQSRLTVFVDAAESSDPDGVIVAYDWTFGDGATATGKEANHTYATWGTWEITLKVTDNNLPAPFTASTSMIVTVSNPTEPPPQPVNVYGYVTDSLGGMIFGAPVTVTDVNSGAVYSAVTDFEYGYYMINLNLNETGWASGDTLVVVATSADGLMTGSASGIFIEVYVQIDVVVS